LTARGLALRATNALMRRSGIARRIATTTNAPQEIHTPGCASPSQHGPEPGSRCPSMRS
jgi:hypothetical protein